MSIDILYLKKFRTSDVLNSLLTALGIGVLVLGVRLSGLAELGLAVCETALVLKPALVAEAAHLSLQLRADVLLGLCRLDLRLHLQLDLHRLIREVVTPELVAPVSKLAPLAVLAALRRAEELTHLCLQLVSLRRRSARLTSTSNNLLRLVGDHGLLVLALRIDYLEGNLCGIVDGHPLLHQCLDDIGNLGLVLAAHFCSAKDTLERLVG